MATRPLAALLLALTLALPARAQDADSTRTLPEISVTATRVEQATDAAPARVRVWTRDVLDERGAATVADALESGSSAFVRRYGTGLASISLRGTGASHTLVLLDGLRLTDPQLGQLDLSLLPSVLFSSVELMHGAGSALYGTDALGGVLHLRTGFDTPTVRLSTQAGAFGERSASALVAQPVGGTRWTAAAQVGWDDGDYTFRDASLVPARRVARYGYEQQRYTAFAQAERGNARNGWKLAGWYGAAERGLGARAGEAGADQWDEHARLWGRVQRRVGTTQVRAGGLVQRSALRYRNDGLGVDDTGRTTLASLDVQADVLAGSRWLLSGGATAAYAHATHPSLADDAHEQHGAVFVTGMGEYGPLLVYPALRADVYLRDTPLTAVSPRLGANLRLTRALRLKASLSRAFRAPTLNDRFWQPGGNPALQPERAWALDAGLAWNHGTARAELTAYAHHTRDQIVWAPRTDGIWAPENRSRVRTVGAEASAGGRWRWLEAEAAFGWTDARDRSDPGSRTYGKQLRYVPHLLARADLSATWGALHLGLALNATGRRFVTADESQALDPYLRADLRARYRFRLGPADAALSAFLENALDTDYAVISGYPMPPRHLRFQLLFEL